MATYPKAKLVYSPSCGFLVVCSHKRFPKKPNTNKEDNLQLDTKVGDFAVASKGVTAVAKANMKQAWLKLKQSTQMFLGS